MSMGIARPPTSHHARDQTRRWSGAHAGPGCSHRDLPTECASTPPAVDDTLAVPLQEEFA